MNHKTNAHVEVIQVDITANGKEEEVITVIGKDEEEHTANGKDEVEINKECRKKDDSPNLGSKENKTKMNEMIRCNKCEYSSRNKKDITDHISEAHTEVQDILVENTTCSICGVDSADGEGLIDHLRKVHGKTIPKLFLCDKCSYISKTKIGLGRHVEYFCVKCSLCMSEKIEKEVHSGLHGECDGSKCAYISTGTADLKDHVAKKHPKDKFPCTKCEKVLTTEAGLMEHFNQNHRGQLKRGIEVETQTSSSEISYPCEECDFQDKELRGLVKHTLDKHCLPSTKSKCDQCDYMAEDQTFLNLHKVNIHEANLPQNELIKVFFNGLGAMIMESNELISKVNADNNKSMWHMMESQNKLETAMADIKTDVKDLKKRKENEIHVPKVDDVKDDDLKEASKENESKEPAKTRKNSDKENICWIGTSISKALDHKKFERDLNVNLTVAKAYCIREESDAKFPKSNFKVRVPQIINNEDPDTVVLQTGSIEITNIDVNKALMDTNKNIDEYKSEWFEKVEDDFKNLFNIAREALNTKNVKKVIIIKRLPRYDRSGADLIGVKSQLSKYANSVYDQLWIKEGSPENIQIMDLDLEGSGKFRDLVYGHHENAKFDGTHLFGSAGTRQFTDRVIKLMKAKMCFKKSGDAQVANHSNCPNAGVRHRYNKRTQNKSANLGNNQSQRGSQEADQSQDRDIRPQSYAEATSSNTGHSQRYSVPTGYQTHGSQYSYGIGVSNRFTSLGN